MTDKRFGLGIDFGTSHTIAMLGSEGGPGRPLIFEGSPLLPSAVFADGSELIVGRAALQQGRRRPAALEPHPKRWIDADAMLLGDREVAVPDAIAAVLGRVRAEAKRVAGVPVSVTVTVPATWGPTRRLVITDAAERAGLGAVRLLPEPVAAAAYFLHRLGHRIGEGQTVVVYDLGAGTFDATVVERRDGGFTVLAQDGRDDLGGLDIDAAIADHLRLQHPDEAGEDGQGRHRQELQEEIRLAKESLSTYSHAAVTLPASNRESHLTRGELDDLARPLLAPTVKVTRAVIAAAGLLPAATAGVFLVGGASRMPLVATMLHQALGLAPTAIDHPELVVAEGSLAAPPADEHAADPMPPAASGTPPVEPAPRMDYRPRPPSSAVASVPQHTDRRPLPPDPGQPRTESAAAARVPVPVVVAAVLLALQAVPFLPLWGGAIETGIEVGALYLYSWELLFGGAYVIVFLAMCASAASVALLLRRIRWAPVLGVYTSLAVPVAVMPVLPNSAAISNWNFLLGLLLIVLPVAIIVNLSRQRTQDWFAAAPRPADARARNRRGITAAGQAAGLVLGAFLLAAYCNEVAPDAFW